MWWTVKAGGPSGPFYTYVAVRDRIYSFGGHNKQDPRVPMEVQVLETENYQWSILKNPKLNEIPYQRCGHTAVVYNHWVYIWGGSNEVVNCNLLYCFDTNSHQWSKPIVSGTIPAPRRGHSACIIDDAMYIFGGLETESGQQLQDLHKLDLKTLKWSRVHAGGEPPIRRDKHTASAINNHMYIFGGLGNDGTCLNEVIYLDTITMNWIRPELKGHCRPIFRGHLAFSYKENLFVFFGWDGGERFCHDFFNDLMRYDPDSCSWSIVWPAYGPFSRFGQWCCLIGDRIFLAGGMGAVEEFGGYYYQQFFDKLLVLEFSPPLKTLCIMAVLEHKLDQDGLPETIRSDIEAMTLPDSELMDSDEY